MKHKTIRIEKVPETGDVGAWEKLNEKLNDLANQGYEINRATDTYILLSRRPAAVRREE